MSRPRGAGPSKDLSDAFQDFLVGCGKFLFTVGLLLTVISVGLLVFTCFRVNDPSAGATTQAALANVQIFQKMLLAGIIGVVVGSTYLYWGEEILGALQIMGGAAMYFSPFLLPGVIGSTQNEAIAAAFGALQMGGTILGLSGVAVLLIDLALRMKLRAQQGSKADQLKYGKGVKEEADIQNVFLGKCWQLPFCRKFVRERCPIYHSKRTCWKERVGCMCEEDVIRNAMENKPVPKDALLAANYIPRNHRITENQKAERCRQCVIYNEHQRHKYKALVPVVLVVIGGIYAGFHGPLINATHSLAEKINKVVQVGTMNAAGGFEPPVFFVEMMLAVFVIIIIAYMMKVLEFLIFKVKI